MNRINISSFNFIKHYINNIRNIIFITIFIINFVNSYYYKSININNRTNLIINQNGIFAYNKKFFKKIKKYLFKDENQTLYSKREYEHITYAKFDNPKHKIMISIKDYIYIFSVNGDYKARFKAFVESNCNNYQVLLLDKFVFNSSYEYYYFVLYINDINNMIIDIYKYDISLNSTYIYFTKEINLSKTISFKTNNNYNNYNNYTCQLISKNITKYLLICFFVNNNSQKLISGAFEIDIPNKFINNVFNKSYFINIDRKVNILKSYVSKDQTKILIFNIDNYYNIFLFIYDMDKNEFNVYNNKDNLIDNFNMNNNSIISLNLEYIEDLNKYILYYFYLPTRIKVVELNNDFQVIKKDNFSNNEEFLMNKYSNSDLSSIIFYLNNYKIISHKNKIIFKYLKNNNTKRVLEKRKIGVIEEGEDDYEDRWSDQEYNPHMEIYGEDDYYEFDCENNKTNITKDKIKDLRDDIMNQLDFSRLKKYTVKGKKFEVDIYPLGDKDEGDTYVDLLECESKIRNNYNLENDTELAIFQIQRTDTSEKNLINKVQYAVYDEFLGELSIETICGDEKIKINYKIKNDTDFNQTLFIDFYEKGINILNSSESFFNDICYPYSDGDSDMILRDRVLDIYQNFSTCEDDCENESIYAENMTVSCICTPIDIDSSDDKENLNLKNILIDIFDDSTIGLIKCYKLVFDAEDKLSNIGFWLLTIISISHIPLYVLFFIRGINPIKNYIITEMKKYHYFVEINNPPKAIKGKVINENKSSNDSIGINSYSENNVQSEEDIKPKESEKSEHEKIINIAQEKIKSSDIRLKYNDILQKTKDTESVEIKNTTMKYNVKDTTKEKIYGTYSLIRLDANNTNNDIKLLESNYTLENYEYETAIKYDNRTFWRILIIIILSKNNILNTFLLHSPLESRPLRICLFLFTYTSNLALNTLFYFSSNISDKYHYNGNYLFWYMLFNNIVIGLISIVLSLIIGGILQTMSHSKSKIEDEFKKEEKKLRENSKYTVSHERKKEIILILKDSLKKLRIKMIIFIVIDYLIILFFYYFTTAFCAVYKHTQASWIYDSIFSFILSFPMEFLFSLFLTILYKASIKHQWKIIYEIIKYIV